MTDKEKIELIIQDSTLTTRNFATKFVFLLQRCLIF